MYITAVRLYCFRSYTELRFEPAKGLNVIVGANAAGKTNILESVFLAALGRSHRTRRDAELINSLSDKAYAGIELVSAMGKHSIELKLFSGSPKQVFIDGQRELLSSAFDCQCFLTSTTLDGLEQVPNMTVFECSGGKLKKILSAEN